MFPDIQFTIVWIVAAEDKVVVYLRASGVHKGDLNGPVGMVPATGKSAHQAIRLYM